MVLLTLATLALASQPTETPEAAAATPPTGLQVDAIDTASHRAALAPRKARVGVSLIGIPAGLGLNAHVPVGRSMELTAGASGAVGWFESEGNTSVGDETAAPYRVRVDLGVDKVLVEAATRRLFVGVHAAGAYWTRMPTMGGNNVAFGPRVGIEQGFNALDVIVSGGLMAHQYEPGNYQTLDLMGTGKQGDSAQVLPQFDVEVLF